MITRLTIRRLLVVAALMVVAAPRAGAQIWQVNEVFTNASGTTQFIELYCPPSASSEFTVNGLTLTSNSDGVLKVYTLNHNLTGQDSTAGRSVLIATSDFGSYTGAVTPDFATLPSGFFNPNAEDISIDFAGDLVSFKGFVTPKDGVNALRDHNPLGPFHLAWEVNTPTNFAGVPGSVNLAFEPLRGDFNGSNSVTGDDLGNWRVGFGLLTRANPVHGDADNDDDVDGNDFLLWQRDLGKAQAIAAGAVATSAAPEPSGLLLAIASLAALAAKRRETRVTIAASSAPPRQSLS